LIAAIQFDARLIGEAASLARTYSELLQRLPSTIHAFILVELQKWPMLFGAEQRYQRALLHVLSRFAEGELADAVSGIARIETEARLDTIATRDPVRFQDEAQAHLRKQQRVQAWRTEVDRFFQTVDPAIEAQLYPADAPRRLVVQIYGSNIAVQTDKLWSRFKRSGMRLPLALDAGGSSEGFLRALFGTNARDETTPALFAAVKNAGGLDAVDTWIVESHEALHELCGGNTVPLTGISFDRLRTYRDELTRALYDKIKSGVESPQAFAAYARTLKIAPETNALLSSTEIVRSLVRDVFLTGNGTLFVNNTFVEWTAVQALRRAQPRLLITRFGVRDKLKPFSSLLLFSQPRTSDRIPLIEDPVGSFVDVEQLAYYVWLNAEKNAAYRRKTLYLFLAEGIDEMLAIRSDQDGSLPTVARRATLADVCATMAQWLGVSSQEIGGRAIPVLVT
jgi:hypothetical protein